MRGFLFLIFVFAVAQLRAQQWTSDWDNYIVSINGKPVSVNVDLGLSAVAPVKDRPYVIILRLKLRSPDVQGMPVQQEADILVDLENRLVDLLARQNGALFAGRFTQRGIREFYFYAPDTLGYERALNQSMLPLAGYEWLGKAKLDENWENYFTVIYPSALDRVKIQSRRRIEEMINLGMDTKAPIEVSHFFSFTDWERRKKFLMGLGDNAMRILSMPEEADAKTGQYTLVLNKKERPGFAWVETAVVPLYNKSTKSGGAYLGWDFKQPSNPRR